VETLVRLENVTYTYPDGQRPALRDVSLTLGPAEIVLVVGASGSGKSTLLRCLNGLVPRFHGGRFAGRVEVLGRDTREAGPRELARGVGLVFQDPESQAVAGTVEREVAFGLENLALPSATITRLVEEALVSTGLSHLRHAPLAELSGGELQRVALAAVLALQPHVIALDEPTSQLDPVGSEDLLAAVRRLSEDSGATVVLAEHRVERCLHLATRVLVLDDGRLLRDDDPQGFARWAARAQPDWLPPVARLFARRPAAAAPGDGGVLPLTVKEARKALAGDGAPRLRRRAPGPAPSRGAPVLEASALTIGYDPDLPLFEDLDLTVHGGEVVALMGENGVGKSTLLRHCNGLMRPLRGRVLLCGRDLARLTVAEAARDCGYLGQNPGDYFVRERLADELAATLEALAVPRERRAALLAEAVAGLDLAPLLERDPRGLSGGERTRAALATVACHQPALLVLDEPTRGTDPAHKRDLAARLRARAEAGGAVLLVTHDVEFAALAATRVVLLGSDGVLADGAPSAVFDGALFFSTQVNRLLRHRLPGVLREDEVEWETATDAEAGP